MTLDQIRSELRPLSKSQRPIIVGPWLSEIGFELLYWVPFLRWAIASAEMDPARLYVLSRGGCRSWYAGIAHQYLELYDTYTPDTLRRLNDARVREQTLNAAAAGLRRRQRTVKQYYYSRVEAQIVHEASVRAKLDSPMVLHPSLMYRAFRRVWRQHGDLFSRWSQLTQTCRLSAPHRFVGTSRPYVAVKFYASEACPDTPDHRARVGKMVCAIADRMPVVLLHTGTKYDEHGEFPIPDHPNVSRPRFDPATNLDDQTALIAGARGFVGTYGGFAYLAPFLGVPTSAFYGISNFRRDHLRLMKAIAARRLSVPFQANHLSDGLAAVTRAEWRDCAA